MKMGKRVLAVVLLTALALSLWGCAMTVEQMYCLPRRSERYENLQTVMDQAMGSLEYSAPAAGENQQTVQMADLDGDGSSEIILFARGGEETPLKILLFAPVEDGYEYRTTIESTGTGFDQVEYVQMDGKPGLELIVGRQVSDQVLRNVSVYSFSDGQVHQVLNANYVKFLTCDLDSNGCSDLFVIHPGQEEGERALAELYSIHGGEGVRSTEEELSVPAENLKRVITGGLESGEKAVFVASRTGEKSIITDVFALVGGSFTNVSFSSESGTSVNTLRNYYVYADDIDMDGVVELPDLITVKLPEEQENAASQHLIRWYAMNGDGSEVEKMFTYHNFLDGWYLELDSALAPRVCVLRSTSGGYQFHAWNEAGTETALLFTIHRMTGEERMNVAGKEELMEIYKTDSVVYAVKLEPQARNEGITLEALIERFRLIQADWNTGEM